MRNAAHSRGATIPTGRAVRRGFVAMLLLGAAYPAMGQDGPSSSSSTSTAASTPSPRGGVAQAERSNISFNFGARYDSNAARVSDVLETGALRAEGEDIRLTPSVTLDVARNIGRHQVGVQSTLGYDFYVRNSSLDSERIVVQPFANLDLPVCDLFLSGSASRRQSTLGDLVLLTPGNIDAAIDNRETLRRAAATVTCGEASGLRPGITVEYSDGRNSNALRRFANYESTRIQPTVAYASPGLGEISVFAVRTETDLPNQINTLGQPSGYTTRGAGLGYRRAIGTRLTFDGSISYVDLTPKRSTLGSQSGINGSVSLSVVASSRLQLVAFASRAFNSSLTSNAAYEIGDAVGLTANYAASDRLRLRGGMQVSRQEYVFDLLPSGPFISRQTQRDIFAGASYTLNRRMNLTFDAGYQKRDADSAAFDYDNVFAAVGLSFRL